MVDRLDGKAAIVTGAASGIGEASALMYASEGASVMCVDLNGDGAAETARTITEAGGKAISAAADLSSPEQAEAMTSQALDAFGRIDVVYSCAGIAGAGTAAGTSMEQWDRVIAVNLTSKWLGFKYALPSMVEQGSGSVIIQASIGGIIGVPGIFPYAAAKGGCIGMMKQSAIEYGPSNIRFNVIAPGQVPTPLVVESYRTGGGMTASMGVEEGMRRAGELYPLRRTGTVEEVAALATYLASDESAWTTGQVFVIDGGITSQ
ncbi:MAG TPA: SDR family oxidoreductase [Acidimicrobiia bacterium]|nr:SDR family oxidoreductase [Acidimicrobiia bacterium]